MNPNISKLLNANLGESRAAHLLTLVTMPAGLPVDIDGRATRAEIAQALNVVLFGDILDRVPSGRAYTDDVARAGGKVTFDHGALRTVKWPSGALPEGESAFTRILRPLGYVLNGTYPLDRIGMTGRSYAHADAPEQIAQFFLSEFHPDRERYSDAFRAAVSRVTEGSADPLTPRAQTLLWQLERDGVLGVADGAELVGLLARCFARQHAAPRLEDYETLLKESAEMAWIATEGNAFNHATDRVADVFALAEEQKRLGRPMKEKVEVSGSGRVKQTAFRADPVMRVFVGAGGEAVERQVPGSFYEFITRDSFQDEAAARQRVDLGFDAGNAQGIFKMTAAA
ncbi:2-oxoadipate dioxygenase/decarboxylase family protein [Cupriavidus campinensis]